MKLSIIIPFYNVQPYTDELLNCLKPQITDEVEVIVVDDGSIVPFCTEHEWVKVIRHDNHGVSYTRNKGLEASSGEYIAFIDADDLVADDYVKQILDRVPFDYLEMSWKSLPGGQYFEYRLNSASDRLANPSAVTRVFSRQAIGTTRFNEKKDAAEDAEFTSEVCKPGANVAVITDFMYFYRTSTPNSLTKRYMTGDTDTKRIVYHYKHITAGMTDLLDEIKRENEQHEVYVLTERCDLPDLKNYAKIMRPGKVRGMELRGEPLPQFIKIKALPVGQVAIYTSHKHMSGIFTWICAFCEQMHDKYDITVLHEGMDADMVAKLIQIVDTRLNGDPFKCETLLMMHITDNIPINIQYKKAIQVVHSTRLDPNWELPKDRDDYIPISRAVQKAWDLKHEPILNMTCHTVGTLHLISATRLKTPEKGLTRMKLLAQKLRAAGIDFMWDCYSDTDPNIKGVTYHPMVTDIRPHIRYADYLVQLSDNGEGFCYSIVEALEEGTPVICTRMDVLSEIGFKENEHGYTFDFEMIEEVNRLLTIPKVNYTYNNDPIKKQWGGLLGKATKEKTAPVNIRCTKRFKDMQLDRQIEEGDILKLNPKRAQEIIDAHYAEIV